MRCETTSDARTFHEWAHEWLVRDPVLNSVILTVVKGEIDGIAHEGCLFAVVRDDDSGGEVMGAAIRTPPFNVYVSPMPRAAIELIVDAYASGAPENAGVTGTTAEATAFAEAWVQRTESSVAISMQQRIHQLDAVVAPRLTLGAARLAAAEERQLLIDWSRAFEEEAEHDGGSQRDHGQIIDIWLADKRAWLWEVEGHAVSNVETQPMIAGVVRVGPVYTPPDYRGRGYASALVAHASRHALDAGATTCSLYTDLANPTSNKIYEALGYDGVADVTAFVFK